MTVPLLVLGAGGLLGSALVRQGLPGLDRQACDVTRPLDRERILDRYRPDAVIFCAGCTEVDRCEQDPSTWAVNVEAPAAWSRRLKVYFISTNYVFSGPGPHLPDGPRAPVQRYGHQKMAAEDSVLAEGASVIRVAWLYGPGGRTFPSRVVHYLRQGRVDAIVDEPVQPTWVDDLATAIVESCTGREFKAIHLVGSEETTWADFSAEIGRRLGLGSAVHRVRREQVHRPAPRPDDARLAPATLPGWSARIPVLLSMG